MPLAPLQRGKAQTPKMAEAAAAEEPMAEESSSGQGYSGSSSTLDSAQRLPPAPLPAPQAPQPGSQAPSAPLSAPAPAPAPAQLPQKDMLVALPIVAIENILSFMSYDEISQLRLVRPPRDPRRPLRRADVWEGAGWEPPASSAGAGARARPSRPQVSLRAPVSGVCPDAALASGLGRLSGQLRLGVLPAWKRGGSGAPTSARPERGPPSGLGDPGDKTPEEAA